MRRVVPIALIADVCIVALVLYNEIRDFIWTHPWWHSFLVAIPGIAAPILACLELRHSGEANRLREEANTQRERSNSLQDEQNTSIARIADLNAQVMKLQAERNDALSKI